MSTLKEELREILEAYRRDCQRTEDYAEGGIHLSQEQTLEAILSTISKHLPEKAKQPEHGGFYDHEVARTGGWNAYHSEVNKLLTTNKKGKV